MRDRAASPLRLLRRLVGRRSDRVTDGWLTDRCREECREGWTDGPRWRLQSEQRDQNKEGRRLD
jgi:hypothetical protein